MKLTIRIRLLLFLLLAMASWVGYTFYCFRGEGHLSDGVAYLGRTSAQVLAQVDRNEVSWKEGGSVHHWFGRPRQEAETVYFDGQQVQTFAWSKTTSRQGFVIRFRPDRVQVYDLENWKGQRYQRLPGAATKP